MARFWVQHTQKSVRTRVDVGYQRVVEDENGSAPLFNHYDDPTLPSPYRESEDVESKDMVDVLLLLEEDEGDLNYLVQALQEWKDAQPFAADQFRVVRQVAGILRTLEKAQDQYRNKRAALSGSQE